MKIRVTEERIFIVPDFLETAVLEAIAVDDQPNLDKLIGDMEAEGYCESTKTMKVEESDIKSC